MKIVIIGLGKVGQEIARALSGENHSIVAIDKEQYLVDNLVHELDIIGYAGNGVVAEDQINAGVKNADIVLAVTKSDETNVVSCLIAKVLGAKRTVARVRDPEYSTQSEFMRKMLGIDLVVNPDKEAADEIARFLRYPSAEYVDTIGNGKADLIGVRVDEDSLLAGTSLNKLFSMIKFKVLACVVERAGEVIIPWGETVFQPGDIVYFTGNYRSLDALLRKISPSTIINSTLIVGGSRITHYLSQSLIESGHKVKIIEKNREKCERLSEMFPKATVICSNGSDKKLLSEEGIDGVDSFITLTGDDEQNILLSLYAVSKKVEKVVTKINDFTFAELFNDMELGSFVSPKRVASEKLVRYTRALETPHGSEIMELYKIADDKAELIMFGTREGSEILGKPLKELRVRRGTLIAGIIRGREFIVPDGNSTIEVGDEVLVVSAEDRYAHLDDVLR
ncbi:MAG: Trk system potassium transporter TrkA [Clostridia bacterium]|nr:Trk system potassium transporter TrkA [Clostridia bacterium]